MTTAKSCKNRETEPATIVHAPTLADPDDTVGRALDAKNPLACLYSESVISVVANLVRGALIGVAEVIPGSVAERSL